MKWGFKYLCSTIMLSPLASDHDEKPGTGLPIPPSITKLDKIYLKKTQQYFDTRQIIAQQGNSQRKENK